ncbi:MAG: methyltransferase domain-containing protein [Oscillospiraceae bacterium]|nr:methyltransferase domain-containing protein [Oscillospiraceae bacterium]
MKTILAGNIARYRKARGLTQEQLATKLVITSQAVSKWETGQSVPDTVLLPKLAQALEVGIDRLFGYSAYRDDPTYYENTYRNTDEYYWGITPSPMCLKVFSLLPPSSEKQLRLIDIGCGEGKDAVFFARCGYDVSGFDISVSGIEKTKRLADNARVHVNVFKADINDYRLDENYDIVYSNGAFHCIKPDLREEIIADYKTHIKPGGIAAFQAFVQKPFIAPSPEKEEHFYPLLSGQLFTYFHDWLIEQAEEYIFDCNSAGVPHRHAVNKVFARKGV